MNELTANWNRRVAVTGLGCVSPLGIGCAENAEGLRLGIDGIRPVTQFDSEGCQCQSAGEIAEGCLDRAIDLTRRARHWHRVSRMTLLALAEALGNRPAFPAEAAIFATTSGGMSYGEAFYAAHRRPGSPVRRRDLLEYFMPQAGRDALRAFHLRTDPWILSNACASGSNAVGHAALLIGTGQAKRVICGGYDALSQLVFAGFDCLRAATPEKCRPFDRNRTGLALGEGAAVLILEDRELAEREGTEVLGEVAGYGAANDNHHLTQPDPSGAGPRRSMQIALAVAGLETVDYVNAHGTGTPHNDASEGRALNELLPGVPVSSTKGAMGHSLGAAGAIEAVFCLLALRGQFLPPNLNFQTPDETTPVNLVANHSRPAALRTALSNSFGFGGSNASLIFRLP